MSKHEGLTTTHPEARGGDKARRLARRFGAGVMVGLGLGSLTACELVFDPDGELDRAATYTDIADAVEKGPVWVAAGGLRNDQGEAALRPYAAYNGDYNCQAPGQTVSVEREESMTLYTVDPGAGTATAVSRRGHDLISRNPYYEEAYRQWGELTLTCVQFSPSEDGFEPGTVPTEGLVEGKRIPFGTAINRAGSEEDVRRLLDGVPAATA